MGDGGGGEGAWLQLPPLLSIIRWHRSRLGGLREGREQRGGEGGKKSVLDIYVQIQWEINEHHRLKKCYKVFGSQQEQGEKIRLAAAAAAWKVEREK